MKILYMCFIYQGLRRIGTILKHNYSAWMLKQARNRCNSLIAESKKWSIASLFNPLMLSQILLSTKFFASPNSLPHPIPTKIWSKDLWCNDTVGISCPQSGQAIVQLHIISYLRMFFAPLFRQYFLESIQRTPSLIWYLKPYLIFSHMSSC